MGTHPTARAGGGELVEPGFRAFGAGRYGEEGRAWIARLPELTAVLAARWRLELGPELPGGLLACVRAVARRDGGEAVLKLGFAPRTTDEIRALTVWAGRGAPRLLEADETLCALLLERIRPGTHPAAAPAAGVAAVLAALRVEPPAGLPTLAAIVRERLDQAVADGRATEATVNWARAKLTELERDAPAAVLLHGDLDERNLLACGRRGLCAIDPSPCAGDPAYDAGFWVHGNRRPGRRARLDAIVAAGGLARERVRDWAAIVGVHG